LCRCLLCIGEALSFDKFFTALDDTLASVAVGSIVISLADPVQNVLLKSGHGLTIRRFGRKARMSRRGEGETDQSCGDNFLRERFHFLSPF
jgi:hypothetical protein